MAIEDFKKLKKVDESNWRSIKGIRTVDYGTYKLRVRTKYRGKSNVERWNSTSHREKMLGFAQRLYEGSYNEEECRTRRNYSFCYKFGLVYY